MRSDHSRVRRWLVLLLCACAAGGGVETVHAQTAGRAVRVGVSAGVVSSDRARDLVLVGSARSTASRRNAGQIGIFADWRLASNTSLRAEVNHVPRGDRADGSFSSGPTTEVFASQFNVADLELPILLRARLLDRGRTVRPFLEFGPLFGLRVDCESVIVAGAVRERGSCANSGASSDGTGSVRYGMIAGTGLVFDVGGREMTLGVRYSRLRTFNGDERRGGNGLDRSWTALASAALF